MESKEYLEQSERTAPACHMEQYARLGSKKMMDLQHAGMGMCTESAEFVDALKKTIFYGKPLDEVNLREEVGDLLWYCALALRALDSDFETEMQVNIDKLKARYAEKFTEHEAESRDLAKEYAILEGEAK